MEKIYWLDRWRENRIGFHQDDITPALKAHLPHLQIVPGDKIFLPLCGKSEDMHWLQQQGYRVLGVEISPIAVNDFFRQHRIQTRMVSHGAFELYRSGNIEILCGDLFDLGETDVRDCRAVLDRAALIAFPPDMRKRYVEKINALLTAGTHILLVTLEYPDSEMNGPPFSVSEDEVRELYADRFRITVLEENNLLAAEPRFTERGLTRLYEKVYLLQKN